MPANFFESPIDTGLPSQPQNVPPELFAEFWTIYNAIQALQRGINQYAGVIAWPPAEWSQLTPADTLLEQNARRLYIKATEDLGFGSLVNLWNDAGVLKARLANATTSARPCFAICNTVGGILTDSYGEVSLMAGLSLGVSGLIPGTRYFLSTTPGVLTNVAPVAAGNIEQAVGVALAGNLFFFQADLSWVQH